MTFNGFISYSHAADGRLAPAVQRGLHRLAKPWHRRRALWIFRDQTGLSVTPALWTSIQNALDGSDYFVLLASPEAAHSQWVNREIEHWMATKSADKILPVVTDGEWAWDPDRHDFSEDSTAVPAALRGVFTEEPLFLDLRWARGSEHLSLQHSRFRDAIAQLAAPMHGVSKDDLEGEDVRQHRRARRLSSAAVATLVVLTVLASVTGVSAMHNAERARKAAAEAMHQQQVAAEQRGSAERFAEESRQQQEVAKQQQSLAQQEKARAAAAAEQAQRSERAAQAQQRLADKAAAEARKQQRLADQAATRTKQQQRRAEAAAAEARKQEAEAKRLAKIADEQQAAAERAAEEARRQQKKADEAQARADAQLRIAVSRRLLNQARTTVADDPRTGLMLGAAAQQVGTDAATRAEVAGIVTSTQYAGSLADVKSVQYAPDGLLVSLGSDDRVSLWDTTDRRAPVRISTLSEPTTPDGDVVLSRDGRTVAMESAGGRVALWDVSVRSRPVRLTDLAVDGAAVLTIASGGSLLATSDNKGITTVWDLADPARPEQLGRIADWSPRTASSLVFSPDGGYLFIGKSGYPEVYDLSDAEDPRRVLADGFPSGPVGFSPDGATMVVGRSTGGVSFYDLSEMYTGGPLTTPQPLPSFPEPPHKPIPEPGDPRPSVAFPTSTEGLSSPPPWIDMDDELLEFDDTTPLGGPVTALAFSRDGSLLAAGDGGGKVMVWDTTARYDSKLVSTVQARAEIRSLSFTPDRRTLVTADSAPAATLWDAIMDAAPNRVATLVAPDGQISATAFRADDRSVIAAGSGGKAASWGVADPAHPVRGADLTVHSGAVGPLAVSPDGRTAAAVSSSDGRLVLTDLTRPIGPAPVTAPAQDLRQASRMAFSPDGRTLAVVLGASSVLLFNVADRSRPVLTATLSGGVTFGRGLAFSPDGRTLATGGGDRLVTLWNVANRSAPVRLASLTGHSQAVATVAFSPDGRVLASGSADSLIMLWDVTDRTHPYRYAALAGHSGTVNSVTFAPKGHTLATGSADASVLIWDTTNPAGPLRLATLTGGLAGAVDTVLFSSDGGTLAVASSSYNRRTATVTLWDHRKLNDLRADPAKSACHTAGRGLTKAEWTRYIPELAYRRTCPN